MDEADFDLELHALLEGRLPRPECTQPPSSLPPAVVAMRAVNLHEPLLGHRARFQMTSFGERGEWLNFGWRDGLRIVSEPSDVGGLPEAGVWVQEEADFYRTAAGVTGLPRFAAGISRLWVEQYVSQECLPPQELDEGAGGGDPWLTDVVSEPNAARITRPIPARKAHAFVGRRAVIANDSGVYEMDLRLIDQPTLGGDGSVTLAVVDEADWFLWTTRSYNGRHPSMRRVPLDAVWVEG